jgi:hypothetical protein
MAGKQDPPTALSTGKKIMAFKAFGHNGSR